MKKIIFFVFIVLVLIFTLIILGRDFSKKDSQKETALPSPSPTQSVPEISSFKVPILMYHYIRSLDGLDEMGKNLSVDPPTFESQLKALKEAGYRSVKLSDIADVSKKTLSKTIADGQKPIVITFDDGYDDAYTNAFPTLQKFGFSGTFFIIRDFVGRPEYMTDSQIEKLKEAGMEIGSHTLSHPDLTKITASQAENQITASKKDSLVFCYPAGKYDDTIAKQVKEAGYLAAVTTKGGIVTEKNDLFELPRIRVENISAKTLLGKIE